MKILVTGCGRSGTGYTSHLLRELGRNMPHETNKGASSGVVDWYAVNVLHGGLAAPGHVKNFKGFKIFHQVRHPLNVIGSACTFPKTEWKYIERLVPGILENKGPVRTMRYWYEWNILAEGKAEWTYTLESIPDIFSEFCSKYEVKENRKALGSVPVTTNSRVNRKTHRKVTWDDLENTDKKLSSKVKDLAKHYGYEV